ncbi:MAG: hypothetical protein AMXMBFR6_02130 [Betaproteobacteria bacterium]
MGFTVKTRIKRLLQSQPKVWSKYQQTKGWLRRLLVMRYFGYDMLNTYRAMRWRSGERDPVSLGAELTFYDHKLEKGLVMPGTKRMFGDDAALQTMLLARKWVRSGYPQSDPVFAGAVQILACYRAHIEKWGFEVSTQFANTIDRFLHEFAERDPSLDSPVPLATEQCSDSPQAYDGFRQLCHARRSVRNFLPNTVPSGVFERAVGLAQLSPSACNRQPCKVIVVSDADRKRTLLSYQNGNRGFGHLVPHVAILTVDERCFFDASERHEPYIDGGLFAMSLILGLRAEGVASCCLNWCVSPENDRAAHRLFDLPDSCRIVMLIAIGYPPPECMVARSPRKELADVLLFDEC